LIDYQIGCITHQNCMAEVIHCKVPIGGLQIDESRRLLSVFVQWVSRVCNANKEWDDRVVLEIHLLRGMVKRMHAVRDEVQMRINECVGQGNILIEFNRC